MFIGDLQHHIIQRDVGLGRHPRRDPFPQRSKLAMPFAITLETWLQPASFALQYNHVVDDFHRNSELRSGSAVQMSVLHKRDIALTKYHSMWLAQLKPTYSLYIGNYTSSLMGILILKARKPL